MILLGWIDWIVVVGLNIRFFSKKRYKKVLWVYQSVFDEYNRPAVYRNVMRVASLIGVGDPAWRQEALWLITKNKFGDLDDNEAVYLKQYIDKAAGGAFHTYCRYGYIDFDKVPKICKKIFPFPSQEIGPRGHYLKNDDKALR